MGRSIRRVRMGAHGAPGRSLRNLTVALGTWLGLTLGGVAGPTWAADPIPRTPAPEGATVYIAAPAHGEDVTSPVTVRFGLRGMGVAPAGIPRDGTGHHHLLIDIDPLPPLDRPLPASDNLRHFGGGQTEVTIELTPGEHTLRLVLGDHNHIPHDPPLVSEPVRIRVLPD